MKYSTATSDDIETNIAKQSSFYQARTKLTIASIDDPKIRVEAQYNPKELALTLPITWTVKSIAHHAVDVSFGGVQPTTLQIELLFDGYEDQQSVQPLIDKLKTLATVRKVGSAKEDLQRPHLCLVVWGKDIPALPCVIESIATKYMVFGADGTALRATCTVSVREACSLVKREAKFDGIQSAEREGNH